MPIWFDTDFLDLNDAAAQIMPEATEDRTTDQIFSLPFTESEIAAAKAHLHKRGGEKSAKGIDGVGYSDLFAIDNDVLVDIFNECLESRDTPRSWLTTALAAILKRGKPRHDPTSYRAIALESCGLKFMTLLIHIRLTEWCDRQEIIPPSQNGFREGYRTGDNVYVLRTAIERARAEGKTLYVAFADLSNAFPSTNHSRLWNKMRGLGAGGKIFDWLRMLYRSMSYAVRHEGEMTEEFKSAIGILAGDTSSPILWSIYLSDLAFPAHPDDIKIGGTAICSLEQADDIILLSTSPEGLQNRMTCLWKWCNRNAMVVNAIKSSVMIFGQQAPRHGHTVSFFFGDQEVDITEEQTYVGFTVTSASRNIFEPHYAIKARKAESIANGILGVHKMIGSLNPWEARRLYMGLVDPHLTHGCEIIVHIPQSNLLKLLQGKQASFIRRITGLHRRSSLVPLFSETDIHPLDYRSMKLTLKYLRYLVALPSTRYAKCAYMETVSLLLDNEPCWLGDLLHGLQKLPCPIYVTDPTALTTEKVDDIIKEIDTSLETHIMREIQSQSGLYLLRNRREPVKDKEPRIFPLKFRHYLNVPAFKHRVALTRLLTGGHALATERMKWLRAEDGRRLILEREARLCRFCVRLPESPEHALLECDGSPELTATRSVYWSQMLQIDPTLPPRPDRFRYLVDGLQEIVARRDLVKLTAKFAHQVMSIYEATPMHIPMYGYLEGDEYQE